MKRLALLAVLCLVTGCKKSSSNVQALLQDRVDKGYYVGIVACVIDPGGTEFYTCGNVSKEANASSVTKKTLFPIASITKVFTTLLLADAVVQGQVRLTDPASKFLPMTLPTYGNTEITVEDLATHTSGLPAFGLQGLQETKEEMYQSLHQAKLMYAPGSRYAYSNIIGLLGDVESSIAKDSL